MRKNHLFNKYLNEFCKKKKLLFTWNIVNNKSLIIKSLFNVNCQKLNIAAIFGLELFNPPFPARTKQLCIQVCMRWLILNFTASLPIVAILPACCYFHGKCWENFHSLVLPNLELYWYCQIWGSFTRPFPKICTKDSHLNNSLDPTRLTSLSQGSTAN